VLPLESSLLLPFSQESLEPFAPLIVDHFVDD
jgi:hypothetical protein